MRCLWLPVIVALSGCSWVDQVSERLDRSGVDLSSQQIADLPYASAYAQWQGMPNALVVLAYVEQPYHQYPSSKTYKWVSQDKGMIVTQAGRITKTIGMAGADLSSLYASTPDPLALGLHLASTPKDWSYSIDWARGRFDGVKANSSFVRLGEHDGVQEWKEVVNLSIDKQLTNLFWVDSATGRVVRSQQQPVPDLPSIEFKVVKGFKGK